MKLYRVKFKVWFNEVLSSRDYTVYVTQGKDGSQQSAAENVRTHYATNAALLGIEIYMVETLYTTISEYPAIKKPAPSTKPAPLVAQPVIDLAAIAAQEEETDEDND